MPSLVVEKNPSPRLLQKVLSIDGLCSILLYKNNNFEDVSPIRHGDFPASHVRFFGGISHSRKGEGNKHNSQWRVHKVIGQGVSI